MNSLSTIFPFYHSVSDTDLLHIKHLYKIRNSKQFEKDIDFFLKYYNPISVDEIVGSINSPAKHNKKSFLLTFDDGFRQIYDIVVPILKRKGIPAVFFVNSAFVDNCDLFYRCKASLLIDHIQTSTLSNASLSEISISLNKPFNGAPELIKFIQNVDYKSKHELELIASILEINFRNYLESERPYLSETQLSEIARDGFYIGAHSVDHPMFGSITIDQQINQITKSIEYITNTFHQKYRLFSFPFTDFGVKANFFDTIYNTPLFVDLTFGTAGIKRDSFERNLQRIPMENYSWSAPNVVLFQYIYWGLKMPLGKNLIKR